MNEIKNQSFLAMDHSAAGMKQKAVNNFKWKLLSDETKRILDQIDVAAENGEFRMWFGPMDLIVQDELKELKYSLDCKDGNILVSWD